MSNFKAPQMVSNELLYAHSFQDTTIHVSEREKAWMNEAMKHPELEALDDSTFDTCCKLAVRGKPLDYVLDFARHRLKRAEPSFDRRALNSGNKPKLTALERQMAAENKKAMTRRKRAALLRSLIAETREKIRALKRQESQNLLNLQRHMNRYQMRLPELRRGIEHKLKGVRERIADNERWLERARKELQQIDPRWTTRGTGQRHKAPSNE